MAHYFNCLIENTKMKTLIFAFALLISANAFAQPDSSTNYPSGQNVNMKLEDGVLMQNGKLLKIENGKVIDMVFDVKLADESTVSKMGTVQRPDGSTMQMQQGDFIKMTGMLVPGQKRQQQKQ